MIHEIEPGYSVAQLIYSETSGKGEDKMNQLLSPIRIGTMELKNRIVMAPTSMILIGRKN